MWMLDNPGAVFFYRHEFHWLDMMLGLRFHYEHHIFVKDLTYIQSLKWPLNPLACTLPELNPLTTTCRFQGTTVYAHRRSKGSKRDRYKRDDGGTIEIQKKNIQHQSRCQPLFLLHTSISSLYPLRQLIRQLFRTTWIHSSQV